MDESARKAAEAVMKAIQTEIQGQNFYRMAAATIEDPKGREVFLMLAEEEVSHEKFLRAHYSSLLERGTPAGGVKLGKPSNLSGSSPIFSEAIRSRIRDAHYEMTALAVGIQLEATAMGFYRRASEDSDDRTIKRFFLDLASWETGHYEALLRQQQDLKLDYWSSAGFAPF